MVFRAKNSRFLSLILLENRSLNCKPREGWQWKSSAKRSGAEIVAHSPTEFRTNIVIIINVLNEGTPKKSLF